MVKNLGTRLGIAGVSLLALVLNSSCSKKEEVKETPTTPQKVQERVIPDRPQPTRVYVVKEGDTLYNIVVREYGLKDEVEIYRKIKRIGELNKLGPERDIYKGSFDSSGPIVIRDKDGYPDLIYRDERLRLE